MTGGAHVDLAGHRSGDEGDAEFFEAVDGVAGFGDEGEMSLSFSVERLDNDLLFIGRGKGNFADRGCGQIHSRSGRTGCERSGGGQGGSRQLIRGKAWTSPSSIKPEAKAVRLHHGWLDTIRRNAGSSNWVALIAEPCDLEANYPDTSARVVL
jgi:hypothetical protein